MTEMIDLRKFGGEIPRLPPDLLPNEAAQQASFCDFAHGHLAPLRAGFALATMVNTVKSIYTEDGALFYTWPTEAWPVKSPVLRDTYNRIYYLDSGVLRVTTTAGLASNGGVPASSYKAGVPRPTVAPGLALVDRSDLRDYPGATFGITVWWEYNSQRYQETTATVTTVTALRVYTFSAPVRDTVGTPEGAVIRATFKAIDAATHPFMTVTLTAGDTDVRSSALPGGVTFALTQISGLSHKLELTYGISETRAYTYTAQNTWLEESPPSPAAQISTTYLQDVAVTLTAVSFAGGYRPLSTYRTYRTVGASPAYLRVKDDASLTFTDSSFKASDMLGALETLEYEDPPASLDAMVRLDNGCLAGFSGTTLYISEAYRPHTWQYQIAFSKNVRGLCVGPGSLTVTTADGGYAVVGQTPDAMQPVPLPVPQAGLAQRSMVKAENQVVYASHDGLVSVSGVQAALTDSQALFARDDWQARYSTILDDASLRLAHHDGCLVGTSATEANGFLLRTDEAASGQLSRFDVRMDSMFQLPVADTLYYSVGTDVFEFRAGAPYSYTWWSKDFIFDTPRNLGAGYIECDTPVTLQVYVDGVLWQTKTLSTGNFRLKSGRSHRRWSVKLSGTATVKRFILARTFNELKNA